MAEELQSLNKARTVQFANGTTLEGVGGSGRVRQRRPDRLGLRSARVPADLDTHPDFDRALHDLGITEQETLVVEATDLQATDTATLRPAVRDDQPRVVLYQDESGGLSWHFEQPDSPSTGGAPRPGLRTAGSAGPVFRIPLRNDAAVRAVTSGVPRRTLRGPITKVGRKIFKVLVLPVLSPLIGGPVKWFAEKVERRISSNFLWQVTPENYRTPPTESFSDWSKLQPGKPVLLIVHGIFSTVQGMLGQLPRATMEAWCNRYEGRVLALNHLTVSESPRDNAAFLLDMLADNAPSGLTFDILCHSRGGVVARSLVERGAEINAAQTHDWRSIYFVATPNSGSPIANADHMVDMIDLFTNALTNLPDGPITYSIDLLLGVVTLIGHAGATDLPGIAALATSKSYIADTLNGNPISTSARYGAAAADYQPMVGRENAWFLKKVADSAIDRIFQNAGADVPNDLVVPQLGVFENNGHPSFPIPENRRIVFEKEAGVWHSGFFAQPQTLEHIEQFMHDLEADLLPSLESVEAVHASQQSGLEGSDSAGGDGTAYAGEGAAYRGDGAPDYRPPRTPTPSSSRPPGPPPLRGPRGTLRRRTLRREPKEAASAVFQPSAERVERDPAIDFHESQRVGEVSDLVVRLEQPGADAVPGDRLTLTFDPGANEIELIAEVNAPGFEIIGRRSATLQVLRERDPELERAVFKLKALDPGKDPIKRSITVSFFQGHAQVGGVTHSTVVIPKDYAGPIVPEPDNVSPVRMYSERRQAADLNITMRRVRDDNYEIRMSSATPGNEFQSKQLGEISFDGMSPGQYIGDSLDDHFDKFPDDPKLTDAQFDAEFVKWNKTLLGKVESLGRTLWQKLPQAFRDEYLKFLSLDEPPRSICVYSDNMEFPWEIVRPSGNVAGAFRQLPPMGVSHVFGRWLIAVAARPQPQARPVQRIALLVPKEGGLDFSQKEAGALEALLKVARRVQPLDGAGFNAVLDGEEGEILHFSGHGDIGKNADLNKLFLDNHEEVTAQDFAGRQLAAKKQPLLFLNACTVGRGLKVLGRSGGFAATCLDGGFSGVVAPYWPVYDGSAARFSQAFYEKLKSGATVGEALQELRAELHEDPSVCAYAYYGDPYARWLIH